MTTEIRSQNTFLRIPDVIKTVGLCKASIYNMMTRGEFPRPKRLSSRAVAWKLSDIQAWIESRPSADKIDLNH